MNEAKATAAKEQAGWSSGARVSSLLGTAAAIGAMFLLAACAPGQGGGAAKPTAGAWGGSADTSAESGVEVAPSVAGRPAAPPRHTRCAR